MTKSSSLPNWVDSIAPFDITHRAESAALAVASVGMIFFIGGYMPSPHPAFDAILATFSGTLATTLLLLWHSVSTDRVMARDHDPLEPLFDLTMGLSMTTLMLAAINLIA